VDLFAPGGNRIMDNVDHAFTVLATMGSLQDESKEVFSDGIIKSSFFITDAWDNAYYTVKRGSSFASPLVAGAAALVWAENPQLTKDQVKSILCSTASRSEIFGGWPNKTFEDSTYGVLDVAAAIAMARSLDR